MAKAKAKVKKPRPTEVEAYGFIRDGLKALEWVVKNPSLGTGGQVWTQNQCLADDEIKAALKLSRPENIIKLTEKHLWIIESKASRKQLQQAVTEAIKDYCTPINDARGTRRAILATGVAGDTDTGYLIKTMVRLEDGDWHVVKINGQEATGLLSPSSVRFLIENQTCDIRDYAPPQHLFLQAAERINEFLHIGGINKNDRAKTMAALLLSVLDEPPNIETQLTVLIEEINARSKAKLAENGKPEFADFAKILPPTNRTNHVKFKHALVVTLQELLNLNIRSAMNSRTDVLGQFYEVFLKYGNGAKEIGIVLTPRHVTRFAVDAVGIGPKDVVLDPACGTGGFLVAAFDHVRSTCTAAQVEKFKEYNLFGIEQESPVALLAIVNMIFRGDGKHNIVEGNCFSTYLREHTVNGHPSAKWIKGPPDDGKEGVTRVLMNPPFALKGSTDQERRFVSQALSLMADGGILFSLLPMDVMFGSRDDKAWRADDLLKKHTLLGVVSFPDELFYPAAQKQVVGVIVRKGFPHPEGQRVFWGRINRDGHLKVKSKRLAAVDMRPARTEKDELPSVLAKLREFMANPKVSQSNIPTLCKTEAIDFGDPLLELVPEAYIESVVPDIAEIKRRLDWQVRENIAGLVSVDLHHSQGRRTILDDAKSNSNGDTGAMPSRKPSFNGYWLNTIFSLKAGDYHSLGDQESGQTPVVSCADEGNGIIGTYQIPESLTYENVMTIAYNGSPLTTKIHPYKCATKDDVAVAVSPDDLSIEAIVFIQAMINAERWRFSYYRKCFQAKLGRTMVKLPAKKNGDLDTEWMEEAVRAQPYWWFLEPRLKNWKPRKAGKEFQFDETTDDE